jgi:hypothetical protein
VKPWVVPFAMLGVPGVTAMLTNVAAVTVSVVEPEMLLTGSVAVMVVVPAFSVLARPMLPAAFEIEATVTSELDQVT